MKFIVVGENIHCTRILKRGGARIIENGAAGAAINFQHKGVKRLMPVPGSFLEGEDWKNGKIRHCAAAIWQGMYGKGEDQRAGIDYISALAAEQERCGASFLDVNVDEFSTDIEERTRAIQWTVKTAQAAASVPVSVDSSNERTLNAGLDACDPARGKPMINSISLERIGLLPLVAKRKPAVIASAAGESGLPCSAEERAGNIGKLMPELTGAGLTPGDIYVDPLVYTISTDPNNGKMFLDAVSAIRAEFGPRLHLLGGLSNVSFGMPNRALINKVFSLLCVEAGGDGGIVDPLQINAAALEAIDKKAEAFALARALLLGQDEFGMEFIAAHREGRI